MGVDYKRKIFTRSRMKFAFYYVATKLYLKRNLFIFFHFEVVYFDYNKSSFSKKRKKLNLYWFLFASLFIFFSKNCKVRKQIKGHPKCRFFFEWRNRIKHLRFLTAGCKRFLVKTYKYDFPLVVFFSSNEWSWGVKWIKWITRNLLQHF